MIYQLCTRLSQILFFFLKSTPYQPAHPIHKEKESQKQVWKETKIVPVHVMKAYMVEKV